MTREELEKLSNIDLVGQLISHAHQFGDVIKETDEFAKELLKRLSRVSDLQKENEYQANNVKLAKSLVATLQTNNNELKQRIEELERENKSLNETRKALNVSLGLLSLDIEELKKRISKLEKEIEQYKKGTVMFKPETPTRR